MFIPLYIYIHVKACFPSEQSSYIHRYETKFPTKWQVTTRQINASMDNNDGIGDMASGGDLSLPIIY